MADNHIIIGLGGRGGDTLKAFRRILFKNSMTATDPREKVNSYPIQYLYLDSSSKDLHEGWDKELGIDYGIEDWARINTREGIELDDIKNNLSRYPTINNWIGDKSAWQERSVNTEVGSGQLRKLGRVYFAASVFNNGDNSFVKKLKLAHDKVTSISRSSEATNYHIIVGLSGGTGSGTIVDVVAQISKFIKEGTYIKDNILVYAILPERNPYEGKDKLHFYHANAYAALKEINAIGLDKDEAANPLYYRPIDVMNSNLDGNNRINAKFTSCFLFSNENENSSIIDYDFGLPNMVGDFLFHRIINLPQSVNAHDKWVKLTENSVIKEEIDIFSGKKERAIKFGSMAIKRIEIPEIEVIDLYGARLLQQLINQQKYNNWEDNKGFLSEKGEDKTSDFVENTSRQDNFIQLCQLTLNHLSLKTPHGIDDFKNSDDEWDTVSQRLRTNALKVYTDGKEKLPIQFFRNYMDGFFSTQFRGSGMGVERYWAEKTKDIEQQSNYFYKKIEEQLLDLWVTKGGRAIGLNETINIIERVIKELKTIASRAANRIGHLTDPNKFDVKDADFTNAGCNKEINKLIGDFGKFVNLNKKGTFETAVGFILKLFKNKTDVIANQYAINLIDRLIKKLDELSSVITRIAEDLVRADEQINEIISEKYKLFRSDDVSSYHQNNVEMLVPKGAVESEFKVIIDEGDTVKEELKNFRLYLKNKCSNNTFSDLIKHFNSDLLIKEHLFYLNLRIPRIYESLQEKGKISPNDKLIGRNVLNYFQNEYKSMSDLENYFKSIDEKTGVYVRLDSAGKNIETLGDTTKDYGEGMTVIQYPSYPEDEDYEKKFKDMLGRVFPNNAVIEATKYNGKSNEITFFKARANLALRSFDMVKKMLRQKYNESYGINEKMASLTLHTEKTRYDFPKLIPFDDSEKETEYKKVFDNELLAYFLLGYTLGFVDKIKGKYYLNSEPLNLNSTNIKELSDSNSIFYGIKTFVFEQDIIKPRVQLQDRLTNILIQAIEGFINKRENTKDEMRKSWIDKMNSEIVPTIFKEDYEEDRTDKEYHLIVNATEKVKNILNLKQ